ncbi:MAG TPA: cytochrome c oxidase assembly protein [Streptosporangiaceae bacterium]
MFAHWSASWPVLIGYVVVAGWHLAGLGRLTAKTLPSSSAQRSGSEQPSGSALPSRTELRREAALFQLGLLVVTLALAGPLGYWATVYIWDRALQTLLLAVVGPGLIVLGAPWLAFGRLLRARPGESAECRTDAVPFWVARPVVAVVVFNAVVVCWQVPALFDPARANAALALVEHVSYVAVGLLLWLQLISSRPIKAPATPLRRVGLLVGTTVVWTVLGMVLVFGSSVLYPAYANSAHHVMTVLDDQQLSGAVLWMGILPAAITAGVALLTQWLDNEESADLSAGLDRLLAQRRGGWPTRPVIR